MTNLPKSKAEEYQSGHAKERRWQKAVTVLAAIVVFLTTYALILPAITWERSLICDKEVHVHGDDCYEEVVVPVHRELTCSLDEHTHGDDCWEYVRELVCTDSSAHQHTDECYAVSAEPARIETIEGNVCDHVSCLAYYADDPTILGYARLPKNPDYVDDQGNIKTDVNYLIVSKTDGFALGINGNAIFGKAANLIRLDASYDYYETSLGNDYWWTFSGTVGSASIKNVGSAAYGLRLSSNGGITNNAGNITANILTYDTANSGIKSTQAGTALRTMMTKLQGELELSGAAFGNVTVKTANADGTMRSLGEILGDLRVYFSQMTEAEAAATAETLVGKNAMSGFLAVMQAAPKDIEKLNTAISLTGSTPSALNSAA